MEYDFKGRYDPAGTEPQLFFIGDTYSLRSIFKKFGLRWDQSKKGWKIPLMEYEAVKKQLIPAMMRDLKTGKTAKRAETRIEKAVWSLWEDFQISNDDYLSLVESTGLSAVVSEAADYDQNIYKLGQKISRAAKAMERQSRSWRTAYNMSVEGKIELDGKRLAKDLAKTKASVVKVERMLILLSHAYEALQKTHPLEFKNTFRFETSNALGAYAKSKTMEATFDKAIKLALRG
jgi:hypothetical protein